MLQSYKPTSWSITAYTFRANTFFNRSFLPSICVVIWIYFLYVLVHRDAQESDEKKTALVDSPGLEGSVVIDIILSTQHCNLSEIEVVFSWWYILWYSDQILMSSLRSIYDVLTSPTASFGKYDCAIGNMSSDEYWWKDPSWHSYLFIFLQTRTCSITINQRNSVSHTFSVPIWSEMCGIVDVLTILLLSPTW